MLATCGYGSLSYAERAKVGATIVKGDAVISIGYNGTPSGWDNRCEDENGRTKPEVLHAERNALAKISREAAMGTTIYSTYSPCGACALDIINKRVSQVVYLVEYRGKEGRDYLDRAKIPVVQLSFDFAKRIEAFLGRRFNWEGDSRGCCPHRHDVGAPCPVPA